MFVAEPGIGFKQLVSHAPGAAATGGNGASRAARIDPSGTIVAFELLHSTSRRNHLTKALF